MKKIMQNGEAQDMNISVISESKKCPICGSNKIKEVRKFVSPDKMVRVEFPVFDCSCQELMQVRREAERKRSIERNIIDASRIDGKFLVNDYKVYRPELIPYFERLDWIKQGKNMMIYGMPGNHKTGHVTAIMKKCAREGISVLYYRASEVPPMFIDRMADKNKKNYLFDVSVLCLDNFGKHTVEASGDVLFNLIDYRMHNFKTTILITNGSMKDVSDVYSLPMLSRIKGTDFIKIGPIGNAGEDLRGGAQPGMKPVDEEDFL